MKIRNKRFDCVEMKRRIQEWIYEETKGMSVEEIVAYYHDSVETGPFADLWKLSARQSSQPEQDTVAR